MLLSFSYFSQACFRLSIAIAFKRTAIRALPGPLADAASQKMPYKIAQHEPPRRRIIPYVSSYFSSLRYNADACYLVRFISSFRCHVGNTPFIIQRRQMLIEDD